MTAPKTVLELLDRARARGGRAGSTLPPLPRDVIERATELGSDFARAWRECDDISLMQLHLLGAGVSAAGIRRAISDETSRALKAGFSTGTREAHERVLMRLRADFPADVVLE